MRLLVPAPILVLAACTAPVAFTVPYPGGGTKVAGLLSGDKQQGLCTHYWPDGKRKAAGQYADDIQVGPWSWWYDNGQLQCQGAFAAEQRTGLWRYWHDNGQLQMQGFFALGRKDGRWEVYDRGGQLLEAGEYAAGERVSRWTFVRDGQRIEGWFFGGEAVGSWQHGGTEQRSYPVPAGVDHCVEVWPGGAIRRTGFQVGASRQGRWLSFHDTAAPRASVDYVDGAMQGTARVYDPEGKVLAYGPVAAGRMRGDWQVRAGGGFELRPVDATRPPGTFRGSWSTAAEYAADDPLREAERWLLELDCKAAPADFLRPRPAAARQPAADPPPEPAAATPVPEFFLTQRELRQLGSWVQAYTSELATAVFRTYEAQPQRKDRSESRRLTGTRLTAKLRAPSGRDVGIPGGDGRSWTLLVLLRGFGGQVCPYCPMQLRALAPFRKQLEELGARVVVVYPGPLEGVRGFRDAYGQTFGKLQEVPYEVFYDVDCRIPRDLDLLDDKVETHVLARPSTFILDPQGKIRYAYVGRHKADRPAAESLMAKLRELSR